MLNQPKFKLNQLLKFLKIEIILWNGQRNRKLSLYLEQSLLNNIDQKAGPCNKF